jgi:hypothetical protein
MGSDHGDVDDLGSGWLEVKKVDPIFSYCACSALAILSQGAVFCWTTLTILQLLTCYQSIWQKHRSSSKFTLQRSPGGSSHKISNSSSRSRTSSDSSRWCDKPQCPPPSIKANFGADGCGSRETTNVHAEEGVDVGASESKSGLNASASEYVPKIPEELLDEKTSVDVCVSDQKSGLNASASEYVSKKPEELLVEKTSEPPKTSQVDYVDPSTPHESSDRSGGPAKCPDLSDHVEYSPKTESICALSNTPVKFGDFDEILSLSLPSDACKDNSSSRHYGHDKDAAQLRNEPKHGSKPVVDETSPALVNGVKTPNDDKRESLDTHDMLGSTLDVSDSTTSTDSVSLSCSNNDLEALVTSSSVASQESSSLFHGRVPASADFGAETAESKERFRQRLWCFLFENLNRAVDELYLLCELECDMEQINESILVLEEAIYDFQELKSRAEHFDSTKKSAGVPKEGMPMTVKADHRRPHALSWEVCFLTRHPYVF